MLSTALSTAIPSLRMLFPTVKAIVLVMGALGKAPMWLAVFADVGVAFLAILNAMRCLYTEKDKK